MNKQDYGFFFQIIYLQFSHLSIGTKENRLPSFSQSKVKHITTNGSMVMQHNELVHCDMQLVHCDMRLEHCDMRSEQRSILQLVCCGNRYGFDAKQRLECVRQQSRHDAIPVERPPLIRRQWASHSGCLCTDYLGRRQRRQR